MSIVRANGCRPTSRTAPAFQRVVLQSASTACPSSACILDSSASCFSIPSKAAPVIASGSAPAFNSRASSISDLACRLPPCSLLHASRSCGSPLRPSISELPWASCSPARVACPFHAEKWQCRDWLPLRCRRCVQASRRRASRPHGRPLSGTR